MDPMCAATRNEASLSDAADEDVDRPCEPLLAGAGHDLVPSGVDAGDSFAGARLIAWATGPSGAPGSEPCACSGATAATSMVRHVDGPGRVRLVDADFGEESERASAMRSALGPTAVAWKAIRATAGLPTRNSA